MRKLRPGEGGVTDLGTMMQPPEQVFIATVRNPAAGNAVMTAHMSLEGAKSHVGKLADLWAIDRDTLEDNIVQLPLLP